jgi:hypothetical protein
MAIDILYVLYCKNINKWLNHTKTDSFIFQAVHQRLVQDLSI